jgi:hypothetical protein
MIKKNEKGEPIFIGPAKILNEVKYLHSELPSFCYCWIWEAKCVGAMEKSDYLE